LKEKKMPKNASFRLNRSGVLLALISAAYAGSACAAAGRVDFVSGMVTVSGSDGRERPLARGAELDNGDTVRTAEGRAQIRFTDGAYVSLQPNTEFAIKDYRYEGRADGSERGFFALAKGAMRTVTGFVGRVNRNRYQITTPTATVGIRGTGGVIQVLNDGSTLVVGTSGIWSLTNPAGSIDVPAGVSGLAPSAPDSPPQQTSQAPQSGPAPITEQTIFTQGEQVTEAGAAAGISTFKPLVTGGGYAVRIGHTQFGGSISETDNGSAVFNAAGQMTSTSYGASFALEAGGSHAEFGTDGVLAWGRWIGTVTLSADGTSVANYGTNQGLHYVVGLPTPVMPTSGTATYSLLGATSPTYAGGTTLGPGKFDGFITVTFGPNGTMDGNFKVAMPDTVYSWAWRATTAAQFGASSSAVTGCSSTCVASVAGFFSGATAERIGAVYHVQDPGKNILGAAAFTK
jgi:hypothetical protein